MLDHLGSEYVIEHVISEHNLRTEKKAYRIYVTDVLKEIAESLGIFIDKRYADIIQKAPDDSVDPDEIVLDIIARAGLKMA